MKKALDISKHQNTFFPAIAKAAGISTAILRAAYGNFMDVRFWRFADDCKAMGLRTGAYIFLTHHYYNKNEGDVNAARTIMHKHLDVLLEILEGRGITSWVALDQELEKGQTMTLTPAENTALLNEAAQRLREAGYTPCVYCSASWAQTYIDMAALTCPVWLAYYYADPKDPDFDGCASIEEVQTKWGAYMSSLGDKLCGWQFGRIGFGGKYGVGSANVDRDWIYFQPNEDEKEDKPMYTSDTLKIGPVSTGDRGAIRTLAESLAVPVVDAGDYIIVGPMSTGDRDTVSNKALALGLGCEDYTAPAEDEKTEQPPAEQPEDKPSEPTAPAVDLSELTQAVERLAQAVVELNEKVGTQITDIAEILDKLSAAGAALQ